MDSGVPVGMYRTYAYIPPDEPFTYDNWCRALRGGNTFLSGGPLLRFTVDGQLGRHDDDRDRGKGGVAQLLRAKPTPVHPWHHDVEQDETGREVRTQACESFLPVFRQDGAVPTRIELEGERLVPAGFHSHPCWLHERAWQVQ